MMLIDGTNEVYMADRDHVIYHVPHLTFWKRKDLSAHMRNTLVDGVCIIPNWPMDEKIIPWWWAMWRIYKAQ